MIFQLYATTSVGISISVPLIYNDVLCVIGIMYSIRAFTIGSIIMKFIYIVYAPIFISEGI